MLYKRIFSGLEQVQGKKASIVIQENEKKKNSLALEEWYSP